MYMISGTVTSGHYSGGEFHENSKTIVVTAKTRKKLLKKQQDAMAEHTSAGSTIDFGFTSGAAIVTWSSQLWKLVE